MDFNPTVLKNRALIRLSGADTLSFLDSLITQSIDALSPGDAAYGGLLTPQGKVISAMLLYRVADDILLETATDEREGVIKRLTLYKMRAAVDITPVDDLAIAVAPQALGQAKVSVADPRHPALGVRNLLAHDHTDLGAPTAYNLMRYRLGIAEGADIAREKDFWLETGAERLNGVSFSKGCYIGQELTARMKHRTSVKKLLLPIELTEDGADVGDPIVNADDKPAGSIRALEGREGLAAVRLDRAEGPLTVKGLPVAVNIDPAS